MPKQPRQRSSSSHSSPPGAQSLLSLVAGLGLDPLLLDCGRIVPALCHSQPVLRQPQEGGTHRLVLSAVCGVKTCSCTTPIFLAPTRHNEAPDRHYKRRPPAGVSNGARSRKMAPRGATGRGQVGRSSNAQGSIPRAPLPTDICENGSCPPTEFRKLSRPPDSERPAQRT